MIDMTSEYWKQYYRNQLEALEIEKKLTVSPIGRLELDLHIAIARGYMDKCDGKSSFAVMDDYRKALKKNSEELRRLSR